MWDKLKFKSLLLTGGMYMYHIAGYNFIGQEFSISVESFKLTRITQGD